MTTIKLSDDFHQEEPLGYLVKNFDTTLHEYMVFANEDEAKRHAINQQDLCDHDADEDEQEEFLVYPLYAGVPTC